jgi:hypothetical protein
MSCQAALREKRATLLSRWRDRIFESYPSEAARFFRDERDQFKNPVGHSIHHATEVLFDAIVLNQPQAGVADALEGMVRVRAVQDLSPSQAVAFVFQLKQVLREGLAEEVPGAKLGGGLGPLFDRIDGLAAMAFDTYVRCLARIHTIRLNELKRRTAVLTARFGVGPDLEPVAPATDDQTTTKGGV